MKDLCQVFKGLPESHRELLGESGSRAGHDESRARQLEDHTVLIQAHGPLGKHRMLHPKQKTTKVSLKCSF